MQRFSLSWRQHLTSAIGKLAAEDSNGYYSDLYVQADAESGELQIYDEDERLLDKVIVFDWVGVLVKKSNSINR